MTTKLVCKKCGVKITIGYCVEIYPCIHEITDSKGIKEEVFASHIARLYVEHNLEIPAHFKPHVTEDMVKLHD